jgi:uncharacterized hydrophobic protein (TIGR00271 family)
MNWVPKILQIRSGTDYENTAASIDENISIKGTNAWLMVCSALLASIGLDTGSTAVVIGAMLISPLMGPILGIGFSAGVHDREMFIRAMRHFAYGSLFSFLTSFLYFLITPLGEPTQEILARTKPTLLDIGVAFFGGVAGIVSGSRVKKAMAIPGVAIATALMPPLCVSGFGLATGDWKVFGGAFYLFFINAVFISLSTYIIVRFLRFPLKQYVERSTQKRVARMAYFVHFLVSVPSIWFLYNIYTQAKTKRNIQIGIIDDFHKRGNEILKWETEDRDSVKIIKTFYSGTAPGNADIVYYNEKLQDMGLKKYRIQFYRMNLLKSEIDKLSADMMANIMKNIEVENRRMQDSLALMNQRINEGELLNEIRAFYPNINAVSASQIELKSVQKTDTVWTSYIVWDSLSQKIDKPVAIKGIQKYLQKKLSTDTVWLFSREQ